MLKINQAVTEGRWFAYPNGVEFKVRSLTGSALREIKKGVTTSRAQFDANTKKMISVEDVDNEQFEDALADYMLEDFKGIGDAAGNVLDVTLANKKLILDQMPLRDFIWNCAQSLDVAPDQVKN